MPSWINRPTTRKYPWSLMAALLAAGGLAVFFYGIVRHHPKGIVYQAAPPPVGVLVSTGTIGMGGSLSQSMGLVGVRPLEAAQVERALRPVFNVRHSNPKDRFEIIRSTAGRFLQMTYWPNAFEYFTVVHSSAGVFTSERGKISVTTSSVGVSGRIQGSLWEAMSGQGVPPEMIIRFAELFGWRMDFLTEPRVGDTYKMIWEQDRGNNATRDSKIICATYTGRESGSLYAYPLAGDYYDADGNSLRGEFLRAPLVYRRISSYFTEHRFHPILRINRPHHGIDYAAPMGTPASSIADGTVIAKGWEGGLGNEVRVRHAGSYVSIYGHLSSYAPGLHIGSHVKQGQVIGRVGSTGLSTGPHLHFGFERDGRLVNFFSLKFKNTRKTIPPAERAHFVEIKKQNQALFDQLAKPGAPVQAITSTSVR